MSNLGWKRMIVKSDMQGKKAQSVPLKCSGEGKSDSAAAEKGPRGSFNLRLWQTLLVTV